MKSNNDERSLITLNFHRRLWRQYKKDGNLLRTSVKTVNREISRKTYLLVDWNVNDVLLCVCVKPSKPENNTTPCPFQRFSISSCLNVLVQDNAIPNYPSRYECLRFISSQVYPQLQINYVRAINRQRAGIGIANTSWKSARKSVR